MEVASVTTGPFEGSRLTSPGATRTLDSSMAPDRTAVVRTVVPSGGLDRGLAILLLILPL
jgi:hypothetical protein